MTKSNVWFDYLNDTVRRSIQNTVIIKTHLHFYKFMLVPTMLCGSEFLGNER